MTNMVVRRRAGLNPWNEMDRIWESYSRTSDEPRKPVVRISNSDESVTVKAELPGFGADDIDIQLKDNLLTIQALKTEKAGNEEGKDEEKRKVVFEKSFVIPDDLEREGFEAEMKNGLLTLVLPRKKQAAPRKIKVRA